MNEIKEEEEFDSNKSLVANDKKGKSKELSKFINSSSSIKRMNINKTNNANIINNDYITKRKKSQDLEFKKNFSFTKKKNYKKNNPTKSFENKKKEVNAFKFNNNYTKNSTFNKYNLNQNDNNVNNIEINVKVKNKNRKNNVNTYTNKNLSRKLGYIVKK